MAIFTAGFLLRVASVARLHLTCRDCLRRDQPTRCCLLQKRCFVHRSRHADCPVGASNRHWDSAGAGDVDLPAVADAGLVEFRAADPMAELGVVLMAEKDAG
jgi:hypothetical protein